MAPSGPGTLLLLLVVAVAGLLVVARQRRWFLQVGGGLLSLVAAAAVGISGVNGYYGYYETWSALLSDVAADNGASAVALQLPLSAASPRTPGPGPVSTTDARPWQVLHVAFPGAASGVHGRRAYVVLPPGATGRLPVLVLVHGEPGGPDSWLGGLQIAQVLRREAAAGRIGPMAVVLPDVRDAFHDQQCLDAPGSRLGTYLSQDVPADVLAQLPVVPAGPGWVVGGLSEGAYCAADLVLHHPQTFGGAALMDGYFHPDLRGRVLARAFGGVRSRAGAHDPTALLSAWPVTRPLPRFWLMAGTRNAVDYRNAAAFGALLQRREDVRFLTVAGARHTTPAWRTALPDLLRWAWASQHGHASGGSTTVPVS